MASDHGGLERVMANDEREGDQGPRGEDQEIDFDWRIYGFEK
jgi:hypothetical protein